MNNCDENIKTSDIIESNSVLKIFTNKIPRWHNRATWSRIVVKWADDLVNKSFTDIQKDIEQNNPKISSVKCKNIIKKIVVGDDNIRKEVYWAPFQQIMWNTNEEEVTKMKKWSSSPERLVGRAGLLPDVTGCVVQSIAASMHDFNEVETLHVAEGIGNYQAMMSFLPSKDMDGGNLDLTVNVPALLEYFDDDNAPAVNKIPQTKKK